MFTIHNIWNEIVNICIHIYMCEVIQYMQSHNTKCNITNEMQMPNDICDVIYIMSQSNCKVMMQCKFVCVMNCICSQYIHKDEMKYESRIHICIHEYICIHAWSNSIANTYAKHTRSQTMQMQRDIIYCYILSL